MCRNPPLKENTATKQSRGRLFPRDHQRACDRESNSSCNKQQDAWGRRRRRRSLSPHGLSVAAGFHDDRVGDREHEKQDGLGERGHVEVWDQRECACHTGQ